MAELLLILWIGSAVLFGGLGMYVADQKGRSVGEGLAFGLLLGVFGLLIEALLPTRR